MPTSRASASGTRVSPGVLLMCLAATSLCFIMSGHWRLMRSQASHQVGREDSGITTQDTKLYVEEVQKNATPADFNQLIDGDLGGDYDCVGWRQTGQGTPDGPREPELDAGCSKRVKGCNAGYCVFRHKRTKETKRALVLHTSSLSCEASFECRQAPEFLAFGNRSLEYVHDKSFDYAANQEQARAIALDAWTNGKTKSDKSPSQRMAFERGITIVVHDKVLGSTYISIRSLRALGSNLPIELWYRRDEVDRDHPVFKELESNYGVFVREILDPNATGFYTKLHAVFYSAFDHVLLLDADNFAVKDPSYLFDTPEYQAAGAMFWPDFWRPAATIFHIKREALLWPVAGISFVDMFEQESAQVLIDRRRHMNALNVLMFYGFSMPRLMEDMRFVWGDKDLFRLAWMKTNSTFHYINHPPGCAGRFHARKHRICGVTMVQHDPRGDVVFLHRNMEKMVAGKHNKRVWSHIQQLKPGASIDHYHVSLYHNVFKDLAGCWGIDIDSWAHYTVTPMSKFPFAEIENNLLQFARDAEQFVEPESPAPPRLPWNREIQI